MGNRKVGGSQGPGASSEKPTKPKAPAPSSAPPTRPPFSAGAKGPNKKQKRQSAREEKVSALADEGIITPVEAKYYGMNAEAFDRAREAARALIAAPNVFRPVMSEERRVDFLALLSHGHTIDSAMVLMGINTDDFKLTCETYPDFKKSARLMAGHLKGTTRQKIYEQAMAGNVNCMRAYLTITHSYEMSSFTKQMRISEQKLRERIVDAKIGVQFRETGVDFAKIPSEYHDDFFRLSDKIDANIDLTDEEMLRFGRYQVMLHRQAKAVESELDDVMKVIDAKSSDILALTDERFIMGSGDGEDT